MMKRANSHPQPLRAITLTAAHAPGHRLAWTVFATLTLVALLAAAVATARPGSAPHGADRPADLAGRGLAPRPATAERDAFAALDTPHPAPLAFRAPGAGGLTQEHALPHRATLRAADRARRAAGRAGLSARRDLPGHGAVVTTADAALARPRAAALEHAGHPSRAASRDVAARGVRGPPQAGVTLV